MPDDLELKLAEFKTEHATEPNVADALYLAWYKTLNDEDRRKIDKHTPQQSEAVTPIRSLLKYF